MNSEFFTVVFKVNDKESFQDHLSNFTEAMMNDGVFPGASVTGCGWGDSMTELDFLESFIEDQDLHYDLEMYYNRSVEDEE